MTTSAVARGGAVTLARSSKAAPRSVVGQRSPGLALASRLAKASTLADSRSEEIGGGGSYVRAARQVLAGDQRLEPPAADRLVDQLAQIALAEDERLERTPTTTTLSPPAEDPSTSDSPLG